MFILDYSARSAPSPAKPTADALWLGHGQTGKRLATATYYRTRAAVFTDLRERLIDKIGSGRRVLLGVDFALGYPAGFADAADLPGQGRPWQRIWDHLARQIRDGDDQRNNRFAVAADLNRRVVSGDVAGLPFWGCPAAAVGPHLSPRRSKTPTALPRRRLVEQRLSSAHEVWKLYTTGAVGSQTLLGLPRLHALRHDPALCDHLRIWPFETGFAAAVAEDGGPAVVVAEVYPSLVNYAADLLQANRSSVTVRDQAQVIALTEHFQAAQGSDQLADAFGRPTDLTASEQRRSINEEGWVLGA